MGALSTRLNKSYQNFHLTTQDLNMRLITLVAFVAVIACAVAAPADQDPKADPATTKSTSAPKPVTTKSTSAPKPATTKSTSAPKPAPTKSTSAPKPAPTKSTPAPAKTTQKPGTPGTSGSSSLYTFSYLSIAMFVMGKYLM